MVGPDPADTQDAARRVLTSNQHPSRHCRLSLPTTYAGRLQAEAGLGHPCATLELKSINVSVTHVSAEMGRIHDGTLTISHLEMDELDSLAVVALSQPLDTPEPPDTPEHPDTNRRDELIAKADRERELGDFNKALALYREAEALRADLRISIKVAGLLTEQGCAPAALREWDQALAKFAHTEDDAEIVAVAKMSRAICAATMDLKVRTPLKMGLEYFDRFVKPHPIREWKDTKVGGTEPFLNSEHRKPLTLASWFLSSS